MTWQWQGKTYETRAALDEAKRRYYEAVSARYRAGRRRSSERGRTSIGSRQLLPAADNRRPRMGPRARRSYPHGRPRKSHRLDRLCWLNLKSGMI